MLLEGKLDPTLIPDEFPHFLLTKSMYRRLSCPVADLVQVSFNVGIPRIALIESLHVVQIDFSKSEIWPYMSGCSSTGLHIGRFIHEFTQIEACLGAVCLGGSIFASVKCLHAGILPSIAIENERGRKSLVTPDERMSGAFGAVPRELRTVLQLISLHQVQCRGSSARTAIAYWRVDGLERHAVRISLLENELLVVDIVLEKVAIASVEHILVKVNDFLRSSRSLLPFLLHAWQIAFIAVLPIQPERTGGIQENAALQCQRSTLRSPAVSGSIVPPRRKLKSRSRSIAVSDNAVHDLIHFRSFHPAVVFSDRQDLVDVRHRAIPLYELEMEECTKENCLVLPDFQILEPVLVLRLVIRIQLVVFQIHPMDIRNEFIAQSDAGIKLVPKIVRIVLRTPGAIVEFLDIARFDGVFAIIRSRIIHGGADTVQSVRKEAVNIDQSLTGPLVRGVSLVNVDERFLLPIQKPVAAAHIERGHYRK